MSTGRILALVVVAAPLGLTAGCALSRKGGGEWWTLGDAPWDRPVEPPTEPGTGARFVTGAVTSVSADGLTLDIEITRGTVNKGDPVVVVMTAPYPSPRNFADEVRERRVAAARVVDVRGRSCVAEILPDRRNGLVSPGDKVTIRSH